MKLTGTKGRFIGYAERRCKNEDKKGSVHLARKLIICTLILRFRKRKKKSHTIFDRNSLYMSMAVKPISSEEHKKKIQSSKMDLWNREGIFQLNEKK